MSDSGPWDGDVHPAGAGSLEDALANLADLAIAVGVNLQRGQELVVSGPVEAHTFVRHVAQAAYGRGAASVTCIYEDPALIRERLIGPHEEALDHAPDWMHDGIADRLRAGAARLQIAGPYPDLLAGVPPERIARAHRTFARASRNERQFVSSLATNCSVVPFVTGGWARLVFPDDAEERARERLWKVVLDVTHAAGSTPRQSWESHLRALDARRDALQRRRFRALRFFDGQTDFTAGLADGHRWIGGRVVGANGIAATPTIPSEEIFTALDGRLTTGRIHFSRPLALGGTLVENLYAEFKDGALISVRADRGLDAFERLIADEKARRLGEAGLVSGPSRIAQTGLMFWNPLFDRNAASHVAFGAAPAAALGALTSASRHDADEDDIHIDVMIGRDTLQVDGITRTGDVVPVIRDGEFVLPDAR